MSILKNMHCSVYCCKMDDY